jgi:hypothetical protein
MQEIYKEHFVRSGARRMRNSAEWKTWTELHFKRDFPTKEEAEREGLLFAKNWID